MENRSINEYYNKLINLSKNYKTNFYIRKEKKAIINELQMIIDANMDYLLNDSLLAYISRNRQILNSLRLLHSNDYDIIQFFMYYYSCLIGEVLSNSKQKRLAYVLMDNDTKELVNNAATKMWSLFNQTNKISGKTFLIERIIGIIMGYCHIYNKFDQFDEIYNDILNEPKLIIENLKLNGFKNEFGLLFDDKDIFILINRVVNRIISITSNVKVIK